MIDKEQMWSDPLAFFNQVFSYLEGCEDNEASSGEMVYEGVSHNMHAVTLAKVLY